MLFNSLQFLIFFGVVMAVFLVVRRSLRLRNAFLLVASYVFYGAWDWRFLGLILMSTVVDYSISLSLSGASSGKRKLLVICSLAVNLGVLGTFKYLDFGIASMGALLGSIGLHTPDVALGIILPVGISFYTFQTIGYTLDVAAGKREPVKNFLDFALFVAYFPQLVAGPIERSTNLLPQLQKLTNPGKEEFRLGALWILTGYFLKVVCADTVAPLVNEAYSRADMIGGPVLFLATLGFTVQIFCDFAGYSLIARGISKWFGIHLMENFRSPYLSKSPREFWRRWHISLSTWLRDYLYFPLGGNRKGTLRSILNILVVFILCGLWHGAGWNFVLFGTFWGLWLACYMVYKQQMTLFAEKAPDGFIDRWLSDQIPLSSWIKRLCLILGVMISFVFFRSPDLDTALVIFSSILTDHHLDPSFAFYLRSVGVLFLVVYGYSWMQYQRDDQEFILKTPRWIRWTLAAFVILSLMTVGFRPVPFIYFQF